MASWVLTFALLTGWFVVLRPQALGGPASYVRVSGISMTPTMHSGDLALTEHRSAYHAGEVIVYRVPAGELGAGLNVIHRIVGGNGTTGWTTKGDHNGYPDRWHPKNSDVVGEVSVRVPGVYGWLSQLRHPAVLAALVGLFTFVLMAWPTKRKDSEDEPDPTQAQAPSAECRQPSHST